MTPLKEKHNNTFSLSDKTQKTLVDYKKETGPKPPPEEKELT